MKAFEVRNCKELNKQEYKIYLEGMAEGIWRTGVELTDRDYHSKMSDPLYIGEDLDDVYSYVFDFHDGGRHHSFENLEEIYEGLIKEIERFRKYAQKEKK